MNIGLAARSLDGGHGSPPYRGRPPGIRSSDAVQEGLVLVLTHQVLELGRVGDLQLEEPAGVLGVLVDGAGLPFELAVDGDHLATHGRIYFARGLHGFDDGGLLALAEAFSDRGKLDIDDVAELRLRIIADADTRGPWCSVCRPCGCLVRRSAQSLVRSSLIAQGSGSYSVAPVLVGEPVSISPEHALNSTGLHSRFPPVRAAREGETDGQRTRTLPAHGRARLPLPALRKRQAVPGLSHAAPELRSVRARLLVRRCR